MGKKCKSCGSELENDAKFCNNCGAKVDETEKAEKTEKEVVTNAELVTGQAQKSKLAAGLLGILLGGLGVHNFYLGYTTKAVIQLLLTLVGSFITCGISGIAAGIWGLVEGIMILTGSINKDADGNPLKQD